MNIQGRELHLERPDKVLYPRVGVSKLEIVQYLLRASGRMLPHLRDRPLTLVRMPDGVQGPVFFQKNTPAHMPEWIPRCVMSTSSGTIEYSLVNEAAALVVLGDQGVGEIHGWVSTCSSPHTPDRVVFDFDPPREGLLDVVREGARELVGLLEQRGASPFVLLTGSRGLHVVVPLHPQATSPQVNAFADAVGRYIVKRNPERFTMESRKGQRGDRVYVDTLRNRRNQTSIMPYSPRIRDAASVAAPVSLSDLDDEDLDPQQVTIRNAQRMLERPDPWRGFFDRAVPLHSLL